jgi:hypothetical protein
MLQPLLGDRYRDATKEKTVQQVNLDARRNARGRESSTMVSLIVIKLYYSFFLAKMYIHSFILLFKGAGRYLERQITENIEYTRSFREL